MRPGLPGGGRYHPLTDTDVVRIHNAALDALENIGMANSIPSCIDLLTGAGARLADNGRILFPRSLVEDVIANSAHEITLYARNPEQHVHAGDNRVYFGTAGAAVHMVDAVSGMYRESTLKDLYDAGRIVDRLDNIHFFQRCMVARDVPDPREMDLNTCYASISATSKHVGTSFVDPEHAEEALRMLHLLAGSEAQWRAQPFVSCSCCFVVPPYRWAEDACRVLETVVRGGMPILLLAAGQAGATSPASLAGAVVQEVAEVLAGLVYVHAIKPGHPAIFGTWPFISDLRTGAMSGGSGEQAVLMAACGQMGRFYNLPTGIAAGMADSKVPDTQSGFEKGYTDVLAAHSGANLIYESAGMQASLLGMCHESLVIDNDMLGAINRTVRGIEVDDESLSLESMRNVCLEGPEHYLGHPQTLSLMQKDYIYPDVSDRLSPNEWAEQGRLTIVDRARIRVSEILDNHFPAHIDPAVDRKIRENFPIKLPVESMRPASDTIASSVIEK
ncbi:MAG: methyltransferase [marine bacterium B5-7]|nr:MAG: methyltransferase [marine bacterium B5-7]